jgi:mannose-6-phosphate isomerase
MVGVATHVDTRTIPGGPAVPDPPRPSRDSAVSPYVRPGWAWPLRMINPIRHYDWGSLTTLAQLQGRSSALFPEAELWMGAHPRSPSILVDVDGRELNLLTVLEADPEGLLGSQNLRRFGPRLPFLLKVIAVDRPLSVHVHPGGLSGTGKSELLVATEPFEALIGLRDSRRAAELFALLNVAPLLSTRRELDSSVRSRSLAGGGGTLGTLARLASWPHRQRAVLTAAVTDAVRVALRDPRTPRDGDTRAALGWVLKLVRMYPDDPLILAPLLLELVRLDPGQAVFIPPGVPHSHLHGTAVEAGTDSGDVLRAGLTRKTVDPLGFRQEADPGAEPILDVTWRSLSPYESAVDVRGVPFRLSRLRVGEGRVVSMSDVGQGPQIVLCLSGEISVWSRIRQVGLSGGESAFLGPDVRDCVLGGVGDVFRISSWDGGGSGVRRTSW